VREVIARVPCDGGARYMHSFGLTENYVVLVEFPWVFSVAKMFKDTVKKVCINWINRMGLSSGSC
jgi:carotenoid cleavage dioxygenase-like enzyme